MKNSLGYIVLLCWLGIACTPLPDLKEVNIEGASSDTTFYYVLNSGLFHQNNASLSKYVPETGEVFNNYFELKNGRRLGDTGNDMIVHGSKVFIAVDVSNTLEVLDKNTAVSDTQFVMMHEGEEQHPRALLAYGSEIWVVNYNGTVSVLDTATMTFTHHIQVGRNPDGIAAASGHVFVTNSGGLDAPNYDSTLYVIDPINYTEIQKINVGLNPSSVLVDGEGQLYVSTRGNHDDVPGGITIIDAVTWNEIDRPTISGSLYGEGDSGYLTTYDYNTSASGLYQFDFVGDTLNSGNMINQGQVNTIYELFVPEDESKIFCLDANGFTSLGEVIQLSPEGELESTVQVGINPIKMILVE